MANLSIERQLQRRSEESDPITGPREPPEAVSACWRQPEVFDQGEDESSSSAGSAPEADAQIRRGTSNSNRGFSIIATTRRFDGTTRAAFTPG